MCRTCEPNRYQALSEIFKQFCFFLCDCETNKRIFCFAFFGHKFSLLINQKKLTNVIELLKCKFIIQHSHLWHAFILAKNKKNNIILNSTTK